ncbi:MAG TPA: endonuclease/exonuclease/phosphatase family protein [Pirellulales bacterium]|nr:endonuclease/exonuclease/phosphatase family protein [Pirellulales bacterium]
MNTPPARMQPDTNPMDAASSSLGSLARRSSAIDSAPRSRRRQVGRRWLIVAAACAVIVYSGYQRRPCGADAGRSFAGDRPEILSDVKRLRIGTFNIHGGMGRHGVRDLSRTADSLDALDLVGLNEVRDAGFGESEGQAEWLGRRLKLRWLFAPTEERWWHSRFGNAVLSALPVSSWQTSPLRQRYSHSCRNAVLVTARHGEREIHMVITHLDRTDEERRHQLRTVADLFLALAEPAVLLGDLNSTQDDPEIARLLSQPGVGDPLGEVMGDQTPPHIDWILTRGFKTVDAGLRDDGASDHPLVWAELDYRTPPRE